MPGFSMGDVVTWASQSNGVVRTKSGTVVCVVPIDQYLWRTFEQHDALANYDTHGLEVGYARAHESYLVAVTMRTPGGKIKQRQKLYWPKVQGLTRSKAIVSA